MCKLQAVEIHMHYIHATSQDFPPIHEVVLADYDVSPSCRFSHATAHIITMTIDMSGPFLHRNFRAEQDEWPTNGCPGNKQVRYVMVLTQGHITKVKVKVHTLHKSVSQS